MREGTNGQEGINKEPQRPVGVIFAHPNHRVCGAGVGPQKSATGASWAGSSAPTSLVTLKHGPLSSLIQVCSECECGPKC